MSKSNVLEDMSLGQLIICRDIIGDTLVLFGTDEISKREDIIKALDDPMRREIQLFKAMKSAFAGQIDQNVAHGPIIANFVKNGVKVTPTGEFKIIQSQLNKMHVQLGKVLGPDVAKKVAADVQGTVTTQWLATKAVMEKSLKKAGRAITKGATAVDKGIIKVLSNQNNFFISGIYGSEHANLIGEVNKVTKKFVEQGLTKPILTERIRETLTKTLPPRADVYYRILSNDVLNRARMFSQVNAYVEARVRRYEIMAVMDERTSEICEYMDGRIFEVEVARKIVKDITKFGIPGSDAAVGEFKALRPWVYLDDIAAKKGNDALFYMGPTGEKIYLPQSSFSGKARGEFKSQGAKTQQVNRQIEEMVPENTNPPVLPPYHAHCRTTTAVDEDDIKTQEWTEQLNDNTLGPGQSLLNTATGRAATLTAVDATVTGRAALTVTEAGKQSTISSAELLTGYTPEAVPAIPKPTQTLKAKKAAVTDPKPAPAKDFKKFTRGKEANAFDDKLWSAQEKNLTAAELNAVDEYTGGSLAINEYLRHGTLKWAKDWGFTKREVINQIKGIRGGIAKQQLPKSIVVYRGAGARFYGNVKEGSVIADKGFTSTTIQEDITRSFLHEKNSVIMEIRAKKGTHFAFGDAEQSEIIFGENTKFRVLKIMKPKNMKIGEGLESEASIGRWIVELIE